MTVSEKLSATSAFALKNAIILFREGNFMKAYDESAFLFVSNLKPYQVNRAFVKTVGREVYSLGFPFLSIEKILSGTQWNCSLDGSVEVSLPSGVSFEAEKYGAWRETVCAQPRVRKQPPAESLQSFRLAYELLLEFYKVNVNVGREYKFSLSEKVKLNLTDVLLRICELNDSEISREQIPSVTKSALESLTAAKIGIRLLYDLKQLPLSRFTSFSKSFTELSDFLHKSVNADKR